ncbi:hypothetical protein K469DRAFT_751289 [Zopfia rhizophila CBS 207.26]|uniref:Uncharacterized protein n=1 Tax=Zopfia rhizophila CBS 207.26 TaxID=1314779 RepID=A0A6A6E172_9PEZI|nr:hypothetical protein K469DRAFT_751289 [Zopfia rhizophila CBS 207.26]
MYVGFAARGAVHVTLTLCIWIACGSKRYKEDAEEAIKNLSRIRLEQGFPRPDGTILHLHVEEPFAVTSACGLLCIATITKDGVVVRQRVSSIGGFIGVNGFELHGVTTAHAMLDDCLDDRRRQIASVTVSDGRILTAIIASTYLETTLGMMDWAGACLAGRIIPWREMQILISWTSQLPPTNSVISYEAGSFAPESVDTFLRDENLPEGPVHILIDNQNIAEGYLFPLASLFLTRGIIVQTQSPLAFGNEAGGNCYPQKPMTKIKRTAPLCIVWQK